MESKEEVIKRWSDTGLLDGINGKKDIAKLLEGEASKMLRDDELSQKKLKRGSVLAEANDTGEPEVSDAVKEWLGRKPRVKRVEEKDHTYSASTSTNIVWDVVGDDRIGDSVDDILDGENDIYDDLYDGDATSDLSDLIADSLTISGEDVSVTSNMGEVPSYSFELDPDRVLFEVTNDDGESVFKVKNNGEVEIGLQNYQQGGQLISGQISVSDANGNMKLVTP